MRSVAALPRLILAEMGLLLLLVPVLTFPHGWLPALGLALPALWLADRPRWSVTLNVPWLGLLLLLAAAAALSTAFSIAPDQAVPKLLALMLGIAVVVTAARAAACGLSLKTALALFLGTGTALAVAILVGTNWMEKWPSAASIASRMPRLIRGLPGAEEGFHPNAGAGALLLFLPTALQIAISRTWSRGVRRLAGVAATSIVFVLVLSQSRGAVSGAALGMAVTGLLVVPRRSRRPFQIAVAGATAVVLLGGLLLLTAPERLERVAGPNLSAGLSSRLELWARTLSLIWDHRWTGLGFNGFRRQIQAEQPLFMFEPSERPPHAHNVFLQTAVDLGMAGFAVYLALLVSVTADLKHAARSSAAQARAALAVSLLAGVLGHLSFGLTDAIPLGTKVGFVFWITLALVAILLQDRPERD